MVLVFGPNLSAPGPKLDLTLGDQTTQTAGRRSLSALRGFRVSNANDHPFPERSSRTRYRHKTHRDVTWVEQAIQLRPACVKLPRHRLLCFLLLPPGLFELPGKNPFRGDRLDLIPDCFLFQEAVEG